MGRDELKDVLDYVLNVADDAEFEVIIKAVQRRQRESSLFSKSGGMSPARAAKDMADRMAGQIGATKESIETLVRGFIEDLIRKNAPGVSEKELSVLVAHYMRSGKDRGASGASSSLPPDAILTMVKRFISYSSGVMAPSEQKALWDEMPRWQDEYWKTFPPEVKALVEGFLSGKIGQEEFWGATMGVLGL